jgi:nicotinamidase-related amidase
MQNDFCSKGGLLHVQGVDVSIVQSIVPQIRAVLSAARKARLKIIYLQIAKLERQSSGGHGQQGDSSQWS